MCSDISASSLDADFWACILCFVLYKTRLRFVVRLKCLSMRLLKLKKDSNAQEVRSTAWYIRFSNMNTYLRLKFLPKVVEDRAELPTRARHGLWVEGSLTWNRGQRSWGPFGLGLALWSVACCYEIWANMETTMAMARRS